MRGVDYLICDNFYKILNTSDRMSFLPGQFYFGHVIYPQTTPKILKMIKYDPVDEARTEFQIADYSSGDEEHYPVKELGLRNDELFHVYVGKKRPIIVLGYIESNWLVYSSPQKFVLCAPVFSFKNDHSQDMIIKRVFGFCASLEMLKCSLPNFR